MFSIAVAFATSALLLLLQAAQSSFNVHPASSTFVGPDGRHHIFHGVNVVEKINPFLPHSSGRFQSRLSEPDMQLLRSSSFSIFSISTRAYRHATLSCFTSIHIVGVLCFDLSSVPFILLQITWHECCPAWCAMEWCRTQRTRQGQCYIPCTSQVDH